jgi:tight adherence protein B
MVITPWPSALTAVAGAVLCWPGASSTRRLRAFGADSVRRRRLVWRLPRPQLLIGAPALLALLLFGAGVAIAVVVGGVTSRGLWRARNRVRDQLAALESMADAVHGLVAELRAGAHPVAAAESAARDARAPADAVLVAIAASARLGGDVTSVLDRFVTRSPAVVPALRPLVHAWSLAQRHGLPLADVLDAVGKDIAGRVRFAHKIKARMAGPRASGTVLAALPLVGILLGEAMGAHPVHVLLSAALGQALLAAGTTLICVGLYWIHRLTSRVVLT